ncbi:hypothetical protein [Sediminibacterium goheungense]|uniref:Lipoprotein n=1 Tax=Sediminibacterium goheungense TaxID=1086393 RepID=A0A4R6IT14_9BACT|nr:hypothetical protein [Sediminibacterium goheungense]TDO25371.1 hypothetical protein BC659_2912 [Sediminibacterium goheungense]
MRKSPFSLLLFFLVFIGCGKDDMYNEADRFCNFKGYYYPNNVANLIGELSNDYIMLGFDSIYNESEIRKFISAEAEFDQQYNYKLLGKDFAVLKFNTPKTCSAIAAFIAKMQKSPIVSYAHYTMKTNDCNDRFTRFGLMLGFTCITIYSDIFSVEVADTNKLADLYQLVAETKTELLPYVSSSPNVFMLKATKNSKADALAMVNYFFESKHFVSVKPDLYNYAVK